MPLRSWFRGGGDKSGAPEYTIDDLIVLERYEEAAARLREKLKGNAQDLHSHLKLAEVYEQLKQLDRAVDEYGFVADEYAQDGFYDKGIALLSRAMKLAPNDSSLREKIERHQKEKSLEHVRTQAIEGLRQAGGQQAGTSALELQRLWHNLAGSSLVERLPGEQLKRLFAAMQLIHLAASTLLVEEGSSEPFLLLVVRGIVDAFLRDASGRESLVRSFTGGDVLGESALLERGAWPANYRVAEEATVLRLGREGLEKCLVGSSDPRGFLELLREQHNDRDVAASVRRMRGEV
ncbi:MAG TPA: cyclic nucleotide-binding domain-containing protein [Thermoanaerobaculia bacterium]|nr:cyclic nucleotide-binding domain-containing protein [Thermoanaerobaculia bacterium]